MKKNPRRGGRKVIAFPEDESAFEELHARLLDEMKPVGEKETLLVQAIARNWADLQNARKRETLTIEARIDEIRRQSAGPIDNEHALALVFLHHIDELEKLQKKEMAIEDLWYRSRHALEREQKRRRKREAAAPAKVTRRPGSSAGIHVVRKQEPSP